MTEKKYIRPLTFWSWNDRIEKQQLKEQIRGFAEQGFGGFFIHSRAGLEIPYMGSEWFDLCQEAVKESQKLGLDVYIYDEDGWPSGFASGKIPALGEEYQFKRLEFSYDISDIDYNTIIASYEPIGNGFRRIDACNIKDGCLIAYYVVDSHYVDVLYHDTAHQFIKHTHETYKQHLGEYFGSVIKGVFTDEPQLGISALHWSFDMPAIFKEKLGCDIIEHLWELVVKTDNYRSFLHDYWKVISEAFVERFSKPLYEWCEMNKLVFTGHFACEDGLCHQIPSNGGVISNYEYMQMPGIDHLGRRLASPVLMKQVTSVAHQFSRNRVLSETFGCAGWDVSFPELVWIWGWQAAFGINQPCLHLSAYSIKGIRKRDYPAFYSYQEPWWNKTKYLSQWLDGVNQILVEGERRPDVLVISPLSGMWCEHQGPTINTSAANMSNQFRVLVESLINIQVDFDLGDERLLAKYGEVEFGILRLGKGSYGIVIIADTISLESSTVKLLNEFINQNGKVLCVNSTPENIEGRLDDNIAYLTNNVSIIYNRRDLWRKYFETKAYARQVEIRNSEGTHLAHDIVVNTCYFKEKYKTFIFNKDEDSLVKQLVLISPGKKNVAILNPVTGENAQTNSFYDDEKTYCYFTIERFQSIWFQIEDTDKVVNVQYSMISTQKLDDFKVEILNDNALTLDYGQYSIDGISFSEMMPVIHMHKNIYGQSSALDNDSGVIIRYHFNNDVLKSKLYLVLEDENCKKVAVNNREIEQQRMDWYIDECMGKYEITHSVKKGHNIVDLYYDIPKQYKGIDVDEVFETERNRFYYPVEPESIYILGDFDVNVKGQMLKKTDHYSIKNAKFSLGPSKQKMVKDLTPQGLWFYRGNASYKVPVNIGNLTDKVVLKISNNKCVLAQLKVNDAEPVTFVSLPFEIDIREHLKTGENKIEIIIYGHNRNILGPHHHIKGQNYFVGVNTFNGTKGFEDFVSPSISEGTTWTDDYSFIPFDVGGVHLQFFKKLGGQIQDGN